MRRLAAVLALLLAHPVLAQFDTPLIPASGGFSETIRDVDISGDVAVVATNGSGANEDTVYVFRRSGAAWWPDTAFVPPDAQLVVAVAVNDDRILVGDRWADNFGENSGAAFVYDYQNGAWIHTYTLDGDDTNEFDLFGNDVELTDSLAVVGASTANPSGFDGAIYVFRLQSDGSYVQEAKLFPDQGFFDGGFGTNFAVSEKRLVDGQSTGKPGFPEAVFYYVRSGLQSDPNGGWVLEDTTAAPPSQPDIGYGGRVAVDGELALITGGESVYAYRNDTGDWVYEDVLETESGSLALSGNLAVAGGATPTGGSEGALYVYQRGSTSSWSLLSVLYASGAKPGDGLGSETAMDGLRAISAGSHKAWVFELSNLVAVEPTAPLNGMYVVSPNPAREDASVEFFVAQPGQVRLSLFDLLGREVFVFLEAVLPRGLHAIHLNLGHLGAAAYVLNLSTIDDSRSKLLTVIR